MHASGESDIIPITEALREIIRPALVATSHNRASSSNNRDLFISISAGFADCPETFVPVFAERILQLPTIHIAPLVELLCELYFLAQQNTGPSSQRFLRETIRCRVLWANVFVTHRRVVEDGLDALGLAHRILVAFMSLAASCIHNSLDDVRLCEELVALWVSIDIFGVLDQTMPRLLGTSDISGTPSSRDHLNCFSEYHAE